jgi:YesN/AraC family two-component response regulator
MKKSYYLFLFIFSFHILNFAQNVGTLKNPAETPEMIIEKKLDHIAANPNTAPKQQEQLLIELAEESQKRSFSQGYLQSNDLLMILYLGQGRYKEAVAIGNLTKKMIPNNLSPKSKNFIAGIYRRNALALGYLGFYEDSLKEFKSAIKSAEELENKDTRFYQVSLCYENITVVYNEGRFDNKKYGDLIVDCHKKSIEAASQISADSKTVSQSLKYDQIAFNKMRLGIYYLEQVDVKGNLEKAEKYLLEGVKIYDNPKYNIFSDHKIMMLNQMSWLYTEKKEYKMAIDFAKRALELEKKTKTPYDRVESFEFLTEAYMGLNEMKLSKYYLAKYSFLKDSLNIIEKDSVDKSLAKMTSDINVSHKKSKQTQFILISSIALLIIMISLFFLRRKNKIIHKKYEDLIAKINHENQIVNEESISEVSHKTNKSNASVAITDETAKVLLLKLKKFETSEKYLRKDLSLTWMANNLNTNPKYLSEVIKVYREHNFTNYINELRINYIVKRLYDNPIYREYKITYLAEECGYTTPRVFVNAFKKETGFTPSYFVEQLKASA